jgi:hypothetical protein
MPLSRPSRSRLPSRLTSAAIVAALLASLWLVGWALRSGDADVRVRGYFVDVDSRGGQCDDKRTRRDARSQGTPWCTVTRAVAAAPPGASVYLRGGSYPDMDLGGSPRRTPVTIRAFPREEVAVGRIRLSGEGNVRLEGLQMTAGVRIGPGAANVAIVRNDFSSNGITIEEGSRNVRILANRISAPTGSGVFLSAGEPEEPIRDVRIAGNHFSNIGISGINARHFRDLAIDGNEFEGVHSYDGVVHPDVIRTYDGGSGLVVRRNFIHDNEAICFFIKDGLVENVVFENNLIVRNGLYGFQVYDVDGLDIFNNTIMNNFGGMVFLGRARNVRLANNLLSSLSATSETDFAFADFNYVTDRKEEPAAPHDVIPRPRFEDPARLDYRLRPHSPGVDAGTSEEAPSEDRLGQPRRGAVDLGALEQQGGP